MEEKSGNRFESNKKYFTISVYALAVLVIAALVIRALFMWGSTVQGIRAFFRMMSPFIAGALIAFVLNPLVKYLDSSFFGERLHMKKGGLRGALAIAVVYVVFLGLVVLFFAFLVPNIVQSSIELWPSIKNAAVNLQHFVMGLEQQYPDIDFTALNNAIQRIGEDFLNFDKIREAIASVVPVIFSTSMSIVRGVFNIIISIVTSVYLLGDSGRFARAMRRFAYAILPNRVGYRTIHTVKECGKIFQNFISGKAVDSLIIGILCFILMTILRISKQYNLMISVIVGVTNMIPYFGPYIGGLIGLLILLMVNPVKALIFLILIVALQQFDGLILGPKILGSSIGLRPVLILFAVTIGGVLFGIVGMFLGAPILASILYVVEQFVNRRLRRKDLRLDPETGRLLPAEIPRDDVPAGAASLDADAADSAEEEPEPPSAPDEHIGAV